METAESLRSERRWALRWALAGGVFGACFPALAFGLRATERGLDRALWLAAHDHLLWIIATAPAVLFVFAGLGGCQYGRARVLTRHLEGIVAARTASLALALRQLEQITDSIAEGLVTITPEGEVVRASALAARWFGPPDGRAAGEYLFADPGAAEEFSLGLEQLREGFLPEELLLEQLGARIERSGRTLALTARHCARDPGDPPRVLLVVRDVTDELAVERTRAEAREVERVLAAVAAQPGAWQRFADEVEALLRRLGARYDDDARRALHTLKGNAAVFGLERLAARCHEAETALAGEPEAIAAQAAGVREAWSATRRAVDRVVPPRRADERVATVGELRALDRMARRGAAPEAISHGLRRLAAEPIEPALERLAVHARRAAAGLGREVDVSVDARGVRCDEARLKDVLASLVHAVRNAVDHGIEDPAEREAQGKPPRGALRICAREDGDNLWIRVEDDGRGVSWDRVRAGAARRGVVIPEGATLLDALCLDGLTTAEQVTQLSGRGVGLAAVRGAVESVGGEVSLQTHEGEGTAMLVVVPGFAPDSMLPGRASNAA